MKTLAKVLVMATFGLIGYNLNAQNRSFIKEKYDKYLLSYKPVDINRDSVPDVIEVSYDLNSNGKEDTRALYIITSKDSASYHAKPKAFMLIFDRDEDGEDDEVFGDSDLDGILESHVRVKKTAMI
jgi:hypothetical protein